VYSGSTITIPDFLKICNLVHNLMQMAVQNAGSSRRGRTGLDLRSLRFLFFRTDSKMIIDADCEALCSVLNIGLRFAVCFSDTKITVSTIHFKPIHRCLEGNNMRELRTLT
jgi:hypothetical protein